jgi:predicted RNA-binding protein with RPS1 domain
MVTCQVIRHAPYGVHVVIDGSESPGIIERIGMEQDGFKTPDEFPPIGSSVVAKVLGIREWSNQVELSLGPKDR